MNCLICKRPLDVPGDVASKDCGGDCLRCMADAGDPDCIRALDDDLIHRLRKRAEIRRQISTRKSVQEGQPDRIADLLDEAATRLEQLSKGVPGLT